MGSISDTDKLLLSRAEDTLRLCDRRSAPCFLGFLDLHEQALLHPWLEKQAAGCFRFYGGYAEAERTLLGVFPEFLEPEDALYPLRTVAFRYQAERELTHRDFLGTLMSAGLRRESIGDILCGEGLGVLFLREEIVPFVTEQVTKVGGEGVRCEVDYAGALPAAHQFRPIHDTVASPRLDAVVKALIRCSRETAAQLIADGLVEVDHRAVSAVSSSVTAPCTVSVRGHGRFAVDRLDTPTRKGRIVLEARQYI